MSPAEGNMVQGLLGRLVGKSASRTFTLPGALGDEPRVLAIDTGNLCDLTFHAPLLMAVRDRHPRTRIDFLLPEGHADLVAPSGLARQCLVYDRRQLKPWSPAFYSLMRSVRKSDYSLSVVMSLTPEPALEAVSLATGAPLRLGPSHRGAYPAVNLEIREPRNAGVYRGARLGTLAPFLDLPPLEGLRGWPLPEEKVRRTRQLIHFNKPRRDEVLVGVDPAPGKSGSGLSTQNLHFVVNQLGSQMPCRPFPLSISPDRDRLARFEAGLGTAPLALPHDTLFDTVLLASLCDLFLAGNTDLFHFVAALGVPTVGLFLKEDTPDWEPRGYPNVRVLRVKEGQRVDIETLMDAVESVRAVR